MKEKLETGRRGSRRRGKRKKKKKRRRIEKSGSKRVSDGAIMYDSLQQTSRLI